MVNIEERVAILEATMREQDRRYEQRFRAQQHAVEIALDAIQKQWTNLALMIGGTASIGGIIAAIYAFGR